MKRLFRNAVFYVALVVVALVVLFEVFSGGPQPEKLTLSQFEQMAAEGKIRTAELNEPDDKVKGELDTGKKFEARYPAEYADELTAKLRQATTADGKPLVVEAKHNGGNLLVSLLINFLPFVLLFGLFFFVLNQMQGGGNRVMQFGKAKTKQVSKDQPKVTFSDVAGCEEAIEELQEIKEFLEAPARFHAMGAKIPKGVLLFGPPGTGKTLLARAVAGEAGVPFFSISGSDFVEMFVGVGASRVRDLFEQAKAAAPAIIFMDEIDAVGRHRGAGLGGGHDEREQTLNQLLVEMDGFDAKTGVILIAATNRPDILDPALLRPGRFDRQIVVDRPDLAGRRNILEVHSKGKPLAKGVDLDTLAKRTPGFTGADLANLLNEAALLSARHGFSEIGFMQLDEAIDRVLAGPERKNRIMSEKERRLTAYHEGGHALVGHVLPDADEVHKVSIVSRGRALGLTWSLPEDRYSNNRAQLRSMMSMSLGGRTAEELVFGEITTGASNDIEKATEIARAMVTQYGMSDRLGPRKFGQEQGEVFLGREVGHQRDYSDDIAKMIDEEIDALIEAAHVEATEILTTHRATLDRLATLLLEKETLNNDELAEIFKDLPPWQRRPGTPVASRPPASVTPLRSPQVSAIEEAPQPQQPPAPPGGTPATGPKKILDRLPRDAGPEPGLRPPTMAVDTERVEALVRELLDAVGEDPARDGLLNTPARMARFYAEVLAGNDVDPASHLVTTFEAQHDELVLVRDIPFYSLCEHHLVPFHGSAHVAYIPGTDGRITGLSKIARCVEGYARRLQVQERLTGQVADALVRSLDPRGALVVVEAEHLCMSMRGVAKPGAVTVTSAVRGLFRDNQATRAEAMAFLTGRR